MLIFGISFLAATSGIVNIIFTNSSISSDGTNDYYEFDVQAYISDGSESPYRFRDGMVYIKYNTSVFGDSLSSNITVTKRGPLAETTSGIALYIFTNDGNYTANDIFAITFEKQLSNDSLYHSGTHISTSSSSPSTILHVKMEFASVGSTNVEWPESVPSNELYYELDGTKFGGGLAESNTTYNDVIFLDGNGDPALPVTLESFVAGYNKGAVDLEWSTASETQNAGFVVKRAQGEDSEDPDYRVIASYMHDASLRGAGTSTEQNRYSHRDGNIKPGATYSYILEDVDHSGNVTRHDPVTVTVPDNVLFANADFRLEPAYPNPFNPAFTLPLELSRPMDVTMNMYDITGRKVRTIAGGRMEAGNYEFRVDGRDLNSGIYFVRSVIGDQVLTQKMLLVK